MIVDSSALLAIVFREPGYDDLLDRIAAAPAVTGARPWTRSGGTGVVSTRHP